MKRLCFTGAATIKTKLVHIHVVLSSEFLCLNHIARACKRCEVINSISAHSSESDVVRLCIRFQCIKVPCVKPDVCPDPDRLMSLKARRHSRSALALKTDGLVCLGSDPHDRHEELKRSRPSYQN